jgi:hypothetical protein
MSAIPVQANDSQADLDRPVSGSSPGRPPAPPGPAITAASGTVCGLAGGLVSGAALAALQLLGPVAQLLGTPSATAGFIVHLIISTALGAGFGVLIRHQRAGAGETVFWGLAYGMSWWYAATLTLLPLLTGQTTESPRKEFFYIGDEGGLMALRYENFKIVFEEQRSPGTMALWAEPFTPLRLPKIFNLRMDPYERADITSNTYWDWIFDHAFVLVPTQVIVGNFLSSFKEFPPSQASASFSINKVVEQLQKGATDGQ